MKIRSVAIFEDELKELLSNPHTSSNMRNAVSLAEQILELKKIAVTHCIQWHYTRFVLPIE